MGIIQHIRAASGSHGARGERERLFFISLKALPLCTTPAEVFILFSENFPPPTPNMDRDLCAKLSPGGVNFATAPKFMARRLSVKIDNTHNPLTDGTQRP